MSHPPGHIRYVLITPARNEERFVEKTIQSVTSQTFLPSKWVIVNDGSTDSTASIVGRYLAQYDWMELVNLPAHRDRSFAAKVHAFNAGFERVKDLEYEVIGNLDSDLSFDADYFEFLLTKFEEDSSLGVAGTIFREEGYSSAIDSFEGHTHVAGGCQLFRRRCFEEIGGYTLWELFRVAYRATKKPYLLGGAALYSGYLSAFLRQMRRPVSDELMRFHRKEQMLKLKAILRSTFRFKRIDSFEVKPS